MTALRVSSFGGIFCHCFDYFGFFSDIKGVQYRARKLFCMNLGNRQNARMCFCFLFATFTVFIDGARDGNSLLGFLCENCSFSDNKELIALSFSF